LLVGYQKRDNYHLSALVAALMLAMIPGVLTANDLSTG
jgi:hypothetical protein